MDKERMFNLLESYIDNRIRYALASYKLIPNHSLETIHNLRDSCNTDLEAITHELEKLENE